MIPLHVLLARLAAALETVRLQLRAGQHDQAARELEIAREQLAEIQKVAK